MRVRLRSASPGPHRVSELPYPHLYARRLWRVRRIALAGQEGLEPPTTGFGDRDSGQLSYCPVLPTNCFSAPPTASTRARCRNDRPLSVQAVYVRTAPPSNRLANFAQKPATDPGHPETSDGPGTPRNQRRTRDAR